MKKKLRVVVAAVALILTGQSTEIQAQRVEKGTFAFEAYYGFPNLLSSALKTAYSDDVYYENYKVGGFGPAGIRAEYFITDHIAFGADVNYSLSTVEWDEKRDIYDNNSNVITQTYTYKLSVPRLRALGKFNFHFGASEHFDWYAGAGLGYNHTQIKITTNDPSYTDDDNLGNIFIIPISGRIDFGGKYYFAKNVGVGFELGLGGGPLASLGICAKF
jgi:opacity protein-like surface antigen